MTFDEQTLTDTARCCRFGPDLRAALSPVLRCVEDGHEALYCVQDKTHVCRHTVEMIVMHPEGIAALPERRRWPA